MFSNYFFLKRLAASLDEKLTGYQLISCFSQQKDELILGFATAQDEFWIRANLDPNISLIAFPESFARARKNSVDLFKGLIGSTVDGVFVYQFERSFRVELGGSSLIFKMHGRNANIIHMEDDVVKEIFRKNLTSDATLGNLDRNIKLSAEEFSQHNHDPFSLLPALGKKVRPYWEKLSDGHSEEDLWNDFEALLKTLETHPIELVEGENPEILLFPVDNDSQTQDPIEAANWLFNQKSRTFYFDREKQQLISQLNKEIRKSENYVFKTSEKLRLVESQRNPEEIANIIMANLNMIQQGLERVTLSDIYQGGLIEIKLNPKLSPQKNAENLYRKSKNRHQEVDSLLKNIEEKNQLIEKLKAQVAEIEAIDNPKELRKRKGSNATASNTKSKSLPYHEFEFENWKILVGKHAKANDELTLKVANKNDLWLHAKDVSGSHVVIKEIPGKDYSKQVIEYAGGLAAFNSKRKTDSLCPVIYTHKKHVRKAKGSPPGQVIVEKEEVLMIEPLDPSDH